jgi:hypothetical protein
LKPTKKSSDTQNQTNIQQNVNISLNAHVFEALAMLDKTNPELAKKAFELIQTDIEEAHKEKQSIIELEKEEQNLRKEELPYIRKYILRGQILAFLTAFLGLGASIYFGMIGMEKVAITSITIPIGVLVLNFINSKKGQK